MVTTRSQKYMKSTKSKNITKDNNDDAEYIADENAPERLYAKCVEGLDELKADIAQKEDRSALPPTPKRTPPSSKQERKLQTPKIDQKDNTSNDQRNQQGWSSYFIPLIIAIICGLLLHKDFLEEKWKASFFKASSSSSSKPSHDEIINSLNELLKTPQFNENVPVIGLTIIKNAFRNALDENEKAPVIVLLMANPKQSDLVRNISQQLANLLTTGKATSIQINSEHSESDIENFYDETFLQQKKSVLLLENLEELDPKNAMVLHQFSDGENSVIKSTFTIVTLKYQQQITVDSNVSLKQLSEISTRELQNRWKPSWTNDNLDCIINRISENTVVLLNK